MELQLIYLYLSSFRYGFFVFEQPGQLDYREEGGPTDSCSPQMSNGRGPFKSTKNFMKKYNLDLTAATFIILDSNDASMEVHRNYTTKRFKYFYND